MKQTVVLSLYGGSGLGKSTLAAEIFVEMKKAGESVELVTEYVKQWAWEGRDNRGLENNVYIFAKQLRRESILYGKVDYIVTDCPLGLCPAYEAFHSPGQTVLWDLFKSVRKNQVDSGRVKHLDFHLMRQHPFKQEGRYETEEEARRVDNIIRQMIPAHPVKTAKDVLEVLVHAKRDAK